ncbi:hypothetical protein [Histophilus somni]|nr:hypothetical protein [Histophilus somni]
MWRERKEMLGVGEFTCNPTGSNDKKSPTKQPVAETTRGKSQ